MRLAVALCAVLLLAGCTKGATVTEPSSSSPAKPSTTVKAQTPTSTTPFELPEPKEGAPFDDVSRWISQGATVDAAGFHFATAHDETTDLGQDVAFVMPSGKNKCMTDTKDFAGTLICEAKFTSPPPRPADAEGEWRAGWINFEGKTVTVGGLHGDPGPFLAGQGKPLDYGSRLTFGDFDCRAETSGLFCADIKTQTAVRISDAGVEPFGCLQKVDPAEMTGWQFSCKP